MIDEPPLLRIRRDFPRPAPALIEAFRDAMTGWVVDAQNGRGALEAGVKPLFPNAPGMGRCCGVALTCACGPDDNLALFAAVALARPGDVIVCASEGFAHGAICGDILAGMAKNAGIAALVSDGMVRDGVGLREVGLAVAHDGQPAR